MEDSASPEDEGEISVPEAFEIKAEVEKLTATEREIINEVLRRDEEVTGQEKNRLKWVFMFSASRWLGPSSRTESKPNISPTPPGYFVVLLCNFCLLTISLHSVLVRFYFLKEFRKRQKNKSEFSRFGVLFLKALPQPRKFAGIGISFIYVGTARWTRH